MINCRQCDDFLMDYINDELPQDQLALFEEHLAACPPCVEYLECYKKTIAMGKSICDQEETSGSIKMPEKLIQAILAAKKLK